MFYTALGRAAAIALATVLVFGLVFLREATSPSGAGYWTAMAAAPNGDLYLADEAHRELRLLHSSGGWQRLAAVPPGIFRALAADGPNLLLATEGKLYVSGDTGGHWRAALPGRFTAVSIRGSEELAGAWADALYVSHDSGQTWAKAIVPPGDTEFEAVVPGLAATLLGLLESTDDGQTWTRVPGLPDRMTALDLGQGDVETQVLANGEAADWRGHVWEREFSFGSFPIQVEPGPPGSGPSKRAGGQLGPSPDRPGRDLVRRLERCRDDPGRLLRRQARRRPAKGQGGDPAPDQRPQLLGCGRSRPHLPLP